MTHHSHRCRPSRAGFTFIEILMVIAIIVVLMSLLLIGLGAINKRANAVQASTEISQMAAAHATARQVLNNVSYLPSQIKLCKVPKDATISTVSYSGYDLTK